MLRKMSAVSRIQIHCIIVIYEIFERNRFQQKIAQNSGSRFHPFRFGLCRRQKRENLGGIFHVHFFWNRTNAHFRRDISAKEQTERSEPRTDGCEIDGEFFFRMVTFYHDDFVQFWAGNIYQNGGMNDFYFDENTCKKMPHKHV